MAQVVLKSVELPRSFEDWSAFDADEQQRRLESLQRSDWLEGFNFSSALRVRFGS